MPRKRGFHLRKSLFIILLDYYAQKFDYFASGFT